MSAGRRMAGPRLPAEDERAVGAAHRLVGDERHRLLEVHDTAATIELERERLAVAVGVEDNLVHGRVQIRPKRGVTRRGLDAAHLVVCKSVQDARCLAYTTDGDEGGEGHRLLVVRRVEKLRGR